MGFVTDVAFTRPGLVACGATHGSVLFFATHDGSLVGKSVTDGGAAVTALAYDPATGLLWAGLEDGKLVPVAVPGAKTA